MSQLIVPETLDVPGLGKMTRDQRFGWYMSNPLYVPILGREGRFILDDDYLEESGKAEFDAAIKNFLGLTRSVLEDCSEPLFLYYKDNEVYWVEQGKKPLLATAELWDHVTLGHEPAVSRRAYGDRAIYISVECECGWELEHGLQLVFKDGLRINKLGSYDGHLTNSDAYGDPQLENVIYHSLT